MASALDRLKALAAAKKESSPQGANAPSHSPVEKKEITSNETNSLGTLVSSPVEGGTSLISDQPSPPESPKEQTSPELHEPPNEAVSPGVPTGGEHPLVMQLAELEAALTSRLPEFRTILRDIHSKLRQDPAMVTALSEEQVGCIVQGLITHANIDVITPKAIKASKKASKAPVSADDL